MKKLLLIMLVLFITGLAFADTVQVGTGTATSSYLPIYGLYGYNYTQQIYTQAQIGVAGNITKIRFYYVSGTITNSKDWVVYMGHTTKTTFATTTDWEPLANLTQVFAGDVTSLVPLANNWMEITLTTPFAYNNTSNLIVAVDENTAGYASMSWGAFTSGANTGIYYSSDTVNPDPAAPPAATSRTATIDRIQFVFPNSAAPLAPTLVAPFNGGWALTGDKLYWTPTAGGSDANTYDVYFGTAANPPLVSDNQAATNYTPTLAPGTTYYWKVVASNEIGDSPASAIWSFMTPGATQLAESFENTSFPPAGWANTGSWYRGTTYYKHGTAGAYKSGSTTATYVLSTPKLTITPTSTLNFWAAGSSTTTSILQVVYSADRITWTQIGANIIPTTTYTMVNYSIDLSSLAGNNYYLGFQNGAGAGTNYIDFVVGPAITPEAPGAPALSAPADLATNVNEYPTITWTAPTTGGVPTGYRLYVDTVNPPTTMVADQTALTYTYTTPLAYNTTYYWTVEAYNTAGTGPQATLRSFTTRANPTISTFPWVEDFGSTGATFPPLNWSQLTGLIGQTLTVGGSWAQDDFANVATTPPNYSGRLNIWSTTSKYWLVTPPVAIPANHELKFDLAYTTYSGTVTPTPGAQADDRFVVLISDNPLMTGATILREWNNTGSPYVYDTISNVGENHIISLGSYTGTKYIAFYGESTVSGGDNNVYVDNVSVRETPLNGVLTVNPNPVECGSTFIGFTKNTQVTLDNTGATAFTVNSIALSDNTNFQLANLPTLPLTINPADPIVPFTVVFNPTTAGALTNNLLINDTRINSSIVVNGTGVVMPVGEICENPYLVTLPLVDYAGTTVGYSNDYTSAMFTGLGSTYYVNGLDWVAKVTIPEAGWLDVSLTNPTGDTTYYYPGIFLVNTIPSLASPAAVLAQAYASTAPINITDAVVSAGDYYLIVDNWPSPATINFVLNMSFQPLPSGPPEPVTITYPANEATGLPIEGFDITWTPAATGGIPDYYTVYMSQDETTLYDDLYWETSNTHFNPVVDGGVTFDYLDRWYFTVGAVNGDGDAVVEPARWFQIEDAPQVITTFPWVENFDLALTPPADWTVSDVDGAGTNWVGSTTNVHSAPNAFKHGYSTAVPDPGQNGWLITPAIQVPAGNYYLSWWNYNVYPTWMVYNGVKVNTTNNPTDPNWVEIWSQGTAASAWSQAVVNISAYAGQTVYFAFNYQGYDGDDWYIDDVSVYELLVDTFGPTITHLPLINTPREDIVHYVVADIADDATWNNPIGGANMYYSIDGGTTWSVPIAMTLDVAPTYYAAIPPQALGTTVTYKIEAWDSLNNMTTSSNYAFTIADPTWIWYDQGGTTYLGYTTTDFGPTVMYENPFYGTGNAMQLLAVDGSSYYGNAANLQIYTYDGVTDLVPYFTTPIAVTFGAQTYEVFDLSTYNVQINTPYFFVSYLDVPMGNYILFDSTYDYGTSYVFQGTTLYTMSNSGSWAIGANVTTGMNLALDTPVVSVELNAFGEPVVSWEAVAGANSYQIYGAVDPYAADPWTLLDTTTMLSYTYGGTGAMQFFKVVADSESPIVRGTATSLPTRSIGNAVKAPKVIINNIRN
ncbi:MAG: hypothetical protein CVU49_06915 [Candidatus Cloacimonetes bacterium HGW-Cloacimonetes-2]|jgi:hypothetical protein|nr:MAG: hypothetical protein CVU49_06915 [Candidatus Cloacimonetes bacterium HGW-Cloacimonetes-2]